MTRERRPRNAYLYLKDTIYNDTLLRLGFRYEDRILSPHGSDGVKEIIFRGQENGQTIIRYFRRNSTAEKQAIHLLQRIRLQRISNSRFKLLPITPEKNITEWVSHHREMLLEKFILSNGTHRKPYYFPDIRIEQGYGDGLNWFELHINVVMNNRRIPSGRSRKNILDNSREYPLFDERIILLSGEWPTRYANLLEIDKESGKNIRLKRPFVSVIKSILGKGPGIATGVRLEKLVPVPVGLRANLCSRRQKGFSRMTNLYLEEFGGCLVDNMDPRRTLQVLILLQYIYESGTVASANQETNNLEEKENTQGSSMQKEAFFGEKEQLLLFPVKTEAPDAFQNG